MCFVEVASLSLQAITVNQYSNFGFIFRITRIQNLDHLFKLDVLDLHGNQVSVVTGFSLPVITSMLVSMIIRYSVANEG